MTSTSDAFFAQHLGPAPVLAILRGFGPDRTLELCRQAWALGIPLVEVPVQAPRDLESLLAAVGAGRAAGRLVGAGTVVSPALVAQVVAAGAAFTVAPGLDEQVVAASAAHGLPHLAGVATATEVLRAAQLGLTWLKAFPAAALGTGWVSAMRGPFPDAHFVATGGIDLDNAGQFLAAGAGAVSLGSAFVTADPERVRALIPGAAQ